MTFHPANNERRFETTDSGFTVLPGFCDVHVHFREPGFSYKETIATGTAAAARGGYTAVCTMPNLDPVPDSVPHLLPQLDLIERDARIAVKPYGAITVGEKGEQLADLEGMAPFVCAFSDDGRGVQDPSMMKEAMTRARDLHKLVVAHCEVNELLRGGYIHDGRYAKDHGHRGICSESEWRQVERDIDLACQTGCGYHVCHIETAPHYLLMDDSMLEENGRFKMNPPVRAASDREALLEGVCDGTIEIVATDHAPHSAEEKARGLEKSAFGIVGIETAFPLLYTGLVKKGVLTLEQLVRPHSENPRKRFAIETDPGSCVWDLEEEYPIDPADFLSKGKATPFEGWKVYGRCIKTLYNNNIVWKYE